MFHLHLELYRESDKSKQKKRINPLNHSPFVAKEKRRRKRSFFSFSLNQSEETQGKNSQHSLTLNIMSPIVYSNCLFFMRQHCDIGEFLDVLLYMLYNDSGHVLWCGKTYINIRGNRYACLYKRRIDEFD